MAMDLYAATIEQEGIDPEAIGKAFDEIVSQELEPWFGIRSQTNHLRWAQDEARRLVRRMPPWTMVEEERRPSEAYTTFTKGMTRDVRRMLGLDDTIFAEQLAIGATEYTEASIDGQATV